MSDMVSFVSIFIYLNTNCVGSDICMAPFWDLIDVSR